MSMLAEVLQNPPSSNWLDSTDHGANHLVHMDPVVRGIFDDSVTREKLLPFMKWAWKRGFLQPKHSEHIPLKPITNIEAMTWLETINKADNDLGLILIRIYQQSAWSLLVQLVVRLLEQQLLPRLVLSEESPRGFIPPWRDRFNTKRNGTIVARFQGRKRR